MVRVKTVALATLFLFVGSMPGAEEKAQAKEKIIGTWTHTVGEHTITFTFKGDTLQALMKGEGNGIRIDADYGVSKDGVLFGRINKVEQEGNNGGSEGDLFSFRFKVNDANMTVSDLKTSRENDQSKDLVEGDYKKQKD